MDIGAWDAASIAIKVVTYASTLSAAGGAAFLVQHAPAMDTAQAGRVRRWLGACAGVAVLATVLRIGVLSGSMGGDVASAFDGTLARMLLEAGEGRASGLRAIGLLAVAVSLHRSQRFRAVALTGAFIAATSFAWVGHAWAAANGPGPVALLSLHLAAVAFWLGALVPLWIATQDGDLARLAAVVRRFGVVAAYVVTVLVAAGLMLLAVLLLSPSELFTTSYGRFVLAKLALVACLVGVASFNKLRLTPRLQRSDRTAVAALRRSIQAELALGVTILLVTAALTTIVGPVRLE